MRTVQQIAESGAAWLTEDELTAIVGEVLALRAENERLNRVLDEAAQHAKDAALDVLAATGIIGDLRAERDERAQWAVADRARIIREVVEKLAYRQVPGVWVSVRCASDALGPGLTGWWDDPESVRAALLDALLGADERAQLAARATDQERDAVASETSRAGEPFHD